MTDREHGRSAAPVRMAHFVLQSPDAPRLVAWYREVLAMEEVFSNGRLTFLTFDDEHHRLAIGHNPGLTARDPGAAGLHHLAFTLASLPDLLGTYKCLRAQEIRPYWCVNHGMSTSMYFRDPDGNQVELQVDNFATPAEARAVFESDGFAANPIGIDFDPDRMLEMWEAGRPVAELLQPGAAALETA